MQWSHFKMIILPPVDSQVLKPHLPGVVYVWPLFNLECQSYFCTLLSLCIAASLNAYDLHGAKAFSFPTGNLVKLFFSTIFSPSSKVLDLWSSAQCVDTVLWRYIPWISLKIPGGFSLHQPQKPTHNIIPTLYSNKLIIWG